ncbi:MAG TPA: DUF4430 domain-containing protein [Conexibacter sp.]|nr:DUF4430 domain-containing protein [Conexibacter sp.]
MHLPRSPLAALALFVLLAAGLAGCGLGAGERDTNARVLVTRDFGTRELGARIVQDAPSSETVLRLLERNFDVETRYGGGFVQSIEGVSGGREDGDPVDWFFFVNGVESEVGAGEVDVHEGDRVWWDHRNWGASGHVPAVVGSYPEPFAHGAEGKRYPLVLECADDVEQACDTVSERLGTLGAIPARRALGTGVGDRTLRVVVGTWGDLREDQTLELIDRGPAQSGVYARFGEAGRLLELLGDDGKPMRALGAGAGLVAATRFEDGAPTWTVTGTDAAGVEAAARALTERRLQRRYAVALDGPRAIGLPVVR